MTVRLERSSSRAGSREEDEDTMDSFRLVLDEELSPFRRRLSDVSSFLSDLRINIVARHGQMLFSVQKNQVEVERVMDCAMAGGWAEGGSSFKTIRNME
jgi:hypothetical protein